jgi:hypothetical protein
VDDDLLVLERRVEVRDDADLPAGRVGRALAARDGERLRRRSLLAPLVEGALLQLLGCRPLELAALRPRPAAACGRDDDEPSRERIAPNVWSRQLL